MGKELFVRRVDGRYPHRLAKLQSENIVATVTEVGRIFCIRLDDAADPEMWMEITVELECELVMRAEPLDAA